MKYLTHILEQENITEYIIENQVYIDEEYIRNFYDKLKNQIFENLDLFVSKESPEITYNNIKNYTIESSFKLYQELLGFQKLSTITNFWDKKIYSQWEPIDIDDRELKSNIPKSLLGTGFIFTKIVLPLTFITMVYKGISYLAKSYDSIQKISKMKEDFDGYYQRLNSLGFDVSKYKQINEQNYIHQLGRCPKDEQMFTYLDANPNCSLDAYLKYLATMTISLAVYYISELSKKGVNVTEINNIERLLAVKDLFVINNFLLKMWSNFNFAVKFIFGEQNSNTASWINFINNSIKVPQNVTRPHR